MRQKKESGELMGIRPDYLDGPLQKIGKEYEWVRECGSGKTGVAHEIRTKTTGVSFCLKTLRPDLSEEDTNRTRKTLKKEAEILVPLSHKCLPAIYADFTSDETAFYLSTFHPGITFYEFIRRENVFEIQESIYLIQLLVDVLSYLHDQGRTHCDLHPKNILLGQDLLKDGILVIDFGSGHRESDTTPETRNAGAVHLKPKRAQANARSSIDRRAAMDDFRQTDIRSLGQLLSSFPDKLFIGAGTIQRNTFYSFCDDLESGYLTDWKKIKERIGTLQDPMRGLSDVRKLFELGGSQGATISIPVHGSVDVGDAPLAAINHPFFQRLRSIPQLSFCSWNFPGATHTRFEHSLGVFELCRRSIESLIRDSSFRERFGSSRLKGLLLASLLHDIGHYPFAHVVEQYAAGRFGNDDNIKRFVSHSERTRSLLDVPEFDRTLRDSWGDEPVLSAKEILGGNHGTLARVIDSAIDIDKLDYLPRDSLHSGIPFGKGLDVQGLINYYCCVENFEDLGITEEGISAAEGFLVLQDQMLASVYWHPVTRAVICQFHALLALIVKKDEKVFRGLVEGLKEASSEETAISDVLIPYSRKTLSGKEREAHQLVEFFTSGTYDKIYRPIAEFRNSDERIEDHPSTIFRAVVLSLDQMKSLSYTPIDWNNVGTLRKAFAQAIEKIGIKIGIHEVIVDVPYGKTSHRRILVKRDDGVVTELNELSHLKETIFEAPTLHLSPIRVFVSPQVLEEVGGRLGEVIESAKNNFFENRK